MQASALAADVLCLRVRPAAEPPGGGAPPRAEAPLASLVQELVALWPADSRVVLELPDGVAIVGLDGPSRVLRAARRAASDPDVSVALHHGPVQAAGPGNLPRLGGPGIARAVQVAGMAGPHVAATHEFREALLAIAPREAAALVAAPEAHLRAQQLSILDASVLDAQRRRGFVLGLAAVAAVLGAGALVRVGRARYAAAHRPALVQLDIRPNGEVWLDGVAQGAAPPLNLLTVPPGRHTLEVRNARAKPLRLEMQLSPGEELKVEHVFNLPAPPAPAPRPQRPRDLPSRARDLIDRYRFW
jgi:hypothetical protein